MKEKSFSHFFLGMIVLFMIIFTSLSIATLTIFGYHTQGFDIYFTSSILIFTIYIFLKSYTTNSIVWLFLGFAMFPIILLMEDTHYIFQYSRSIKPILYTIMYIIGSCLFLKLFKTNKGIIVLVFLMFLYGIFSYQTIRFKNEKPAIPKIRIIES